MSVVGDIKTIVDYLGKLHNENNSVKKKIQEEFFDKVYEMTKDIYTDFYNILFKALSDIQNSDVSIGSIVRELNNQRLPFKTARDEIASTIVLPVYQGDVNTYLFIVGVAGVLQGGLKLVDERAIEVIKNCKVNGNIRNIPLRGTHTILDVIHGYEKYTQGSLETNQQNEEKKDRESLKGKLELQIRHIELFWKVTCEAYQKIKYDNIIDAIF